MLAVSTNIPIMKNIEKISEYNCPFCKSENIKLFCSALPQRDTIQNIEEYKILKCNNCKIVFLSPEPTKKELSYLYSKYFDKANKNDVLYDKRLDRKARNLSNYVKLSKGRILDIGSGFGRDLLAFKKIGWDTYGVEKSELAAKFTIDELKLNVFNGELTQACFPPNFFNIIILYHTFEHIYNPFEILKEISRILKQDGLLVIAVPNMENIEARIFRKYWTMGLDVPAHLFHYSQKTLTDVLNKSSFQVDTIKYLSGTSSLSSSIGNIVREIFLMVHKSKKNKNNNPRNISKVQMDKFHKGNRTLMHRTIVILYYSFLKVIDCILIPIPFIMDKFKIGSSIIIFAKTKKFI